MNLEILIPFPQLLKSAEFLNYDEQIQQIARIRQIQRGITLIHAMPDARLGTQYVQYDYWTDGNVLRWTPYRYYLVRYAAALQFHIDKNKSYTRYHWEKIKIYSRLSDYSPKDAFNILKKYKKPDFVTVEFCKSCQQKILKERLF